jgi:hypothetical protein
VDTLHVSTGRLTTAQARAVQSWREGLHEGDERLRASTSDCLAAAVHALLRTAPDPLDVAQVAEAGRRAAVLRNDLGAVAVSVYVGGEDSAGYLALVDQAAQAVVELAERLVAQLLDQGVEAGLAMTTVAAQLAGRGLPRPGRTIPRGAVVRLAIERWTARPVADVLADAVAWSQSHHRQLHRARSDMRNL